MCAPTARLVHPFGAATATAVDEPEVIGVAPEVSGTDAVRPDAAADKALVDQVLADLKANFEKWEAVLAAQEAVTFTADVGDIYAVCNSDGRLTGLSLAPHVTTSYTCRELVDRLNMVFEALRQEAQADFDRNYGGGIVE
ncbi:DUF2710 family protein [Mycobacterium alsense]|uniref:DUF2710 family protein n=1 Tax=Mycobacterium alsense TaxID=324058 RepID=UPI000E757AB2|nr:DUF2710 family protein [Mycobacterium alsense]